MLLVLFAIPFSIFLIVVVVDVAFAVVEWQSRIHIGRWNDRHQWQQAVAKKAKRWLRKAPTVRKTAQNRLVLIDVLRGEFRSSVIQKWQDAGLLMGLGKECAESYVSSRKNLFSDSHVMPEDLLLAYSLKLYGLLTEERERIVMSSFQSLKDDGTIYYRPWVKRIRFVDTLGMVLPFLHACGWDDLAERQLREYDAALLHGTYPAHAYDLDKQLPLGAHDWSRGMGWYVLALTETADMLGHDQRILRLSESLLPLQKADGGFSCFVFNQRERNESSGTALIGLLFVEAYRFSNDRKYLDAALLAEQALMKATRRNGALDDCQGDTYGIGYYSQRFSIMPFAQGMALLLSKRIDAVLNENTQLG